MNEQANPPMHTEGAVGDYFTLEAHILSTRSADAYKAVDKSRREPICLWMLRHPLEIGSEAVRRFLERMYRIDQIDPQVTEMTAYGVDSVGMAFATFPPLDGHSAISGNIERNEAERRFMGCLKMVDLLHRNNIVCGDLSGGSFWIRRDGEIRFLGIMGSFDAEAAATAMAPPLETLPYIAPEQRGGGGVEIASDVFALGVLGHLLVTGKYPYGEGAEAMINPCDPRSINLLEHTGVPPVWADEVLKGCLQPNPDSRPKSAGEVLSMIRTIKERVLADESAPLKPGSIRRGLAVNNKQEQSGTSASYTKDSQSEPKRVTPVRVAIGATAVMAAAVAGGLFWQSAPSDVTPSFRDELLRHKDAITDPSLRDAVDQIAAGSGAAEDKARKLEEIASSDDPLAHSILVKSAEEAENEQFRIMSETALLKRARRLGLFRSAEQARGWLRQVTEPQKSPAYEPVLKLLDRSLPPEGRDSLLRRAYASEAKFSLRLAVALALDRDELVEMQGIISQLVGDSLALSNAKEYSTLSLILGHSDLALTFGEDAIQKRDAIPDKDILWLLETLAERNDFNVRAIASLAVERGVLSPTRNYYLELVRDRNDLSPELLTSLIRAAGGVLRVSDITAFGRWYDREVEPILLSVLAENSDEEVLREAFDTLIGRTLSIEPSASLAQWVRENYWEEREKLATAVGIMGRVDLVSDEELEKAFDSFDRFVRDSDLIDILLEAESPRITNRVISRYSEMLGLGTLLSLLDQSDKRVRITAVKALKGYNDIGALKLIIDAYERERDPEVRAVYEETFWVIRERKEGK